MKKIFVLSFWAAVVVLSWNCRTTPEPELPYIDSPNGCRATQTDLTAWSYSPHTYTFTLPVGFPMPEIPADNPMTVEGVHLGHYLFYEKRLSVNNTQSCGTCHQLRKAFTDGTVLSPGAVPGLLSHRNSMSLINIAYASNGGRATNFMWDGKFATLEQQHLGPVENPVEMAADWRDVECFLRNDTMYQRLFREAFGIENNLQITKDLAAKAMAQFVRTLISAGSKYDMVKGPGAIFGMEFTDAEEEGWTMFFNNTAGFVNNNFTLPDAECGHCHNTYLMTNNNFFNNGLDSFPTLADYIDKGLGGITNLNIDNGKFRCTTLRNIELTGPYMHDGRFNTLEEVMDQYVHHVHDAANLDINLKLPARPGQSIQNLTPVQIDEVVAFLKTLTDTSYFNKTEWADPF